jgi:DNA-binding MarR family transcriptional regulator
VSDAADSDEVPWLDDGQLQDWRSLMGMLMTLPAALEAQLKRDAGVNVFEYHVLASLSDAPDGTRLMSHLAGLAQGSLSRLSHAVSRLERAGWVTRRSCGGAGRRTEAILTEAGRRKLEEIAPGHLREVRRLVVDALTPEQLTALGAAARVVMAKADPVSAELLGHSPEICGAAGGFSAPGTAAGTAPGAAAGTAPGTAPGRPDTGSGVDVPPC